MISTIKCLDFKVFGVTLVEALHITPAGLNVRFLASTRQYKTNQRIQKKILEIELAVNALVTLTDLTFGLGGCCELYANNVVRFVHEC